MRRVRASASGVSLCATVSIAVSALVLDAPSAQAETMLERVRLQAAATAQDFEDDPTSALPKIPWVVQTRTVSLLGAEMATTRFSDGAGAAKDFGAGLMAQLDYAKEEQPALGGLWGQSFALGLDTAFGTSGTHYYGRGSGHAEFGTMATFGPRLHAFYLRFRGNIASFRDSQDSYSSGAVNIPIGLRFVLDQTAIELGGVSALGWMSVLQSEQHYGSGPLFFGAQARLLTSAGYFEVQKMLAVSPADADHTTLLTCGHLKYVVVCAEGTWLRLHDLSRGDEAHYARVGLRIGIGNWEHRSEHRERNWLVPTVEAR